MFDSSDPASPLEAIKADFLLKMDKRGNESAGTVIQEFVGQHPNIPNLERELRSLVDLPQKLSESRPENKPALPDRLGEFEIIREMAHGGMGEIYEASHNRLHRRVVIKVIRRGRCSPDAKIRFEREQQVLACLHQTNIIPIYTAGEHEDIQYYAMPYIEGANLNSVVGHIKSAHSSTSHDTPSLVELIGRVVKETEEKYKETRASTVGTNKKAEPESTAHGDTEITQQLAPAISKPTRLSNEYFRSVAETMASAAQAVHHVHQAGFLHRDIKPANIMVDHTGHAWMIDFGLAKALESTNGTDRAVFRAQLQSDEPLTQLGVSPGTPPYMAPEQWRQENLDERTDVWALGVTLYELLTLRRPFGNTNGNVQKLEKEIREMSPSSPRRLITNLPKDLAAICDMAISKAAKERYSTATELADDLRRWQRLEPTKARPALLPRRMWLWARRNPGWAVAALISLMFAALSAGLGATEFERNREALREARRGEFVEKVVSIGRTYRKSGWFDDAWNYTRKAASIRTSRELRSEAVTLLAGPDAKVSKDFSGFDVSSVVFGPNGKQLLIGGGPKSPARIWDGAINDFAAAKIKGAGPVTFRGNAPLQLVLSKDKKRLLLWDVESQKPAGQFGIPGGAFQRPVLALAAGAGLVGAGEMQAGFKPAIHVWDGATGKLKYTFEQAATSLAFSPNSKFLAAGTANGLIFLRSMETGKSVGAPLYVHRPSIHSLAFGWNRWTKRPGKPGLHNWLLAAGDAGGAVTIWNLETGHPMAYCRGHQHHVTAVTFNPDSTILACSGRDSKLWDVATGRLLLGLRGIDYVSGLAFTPDGRQLARSYGQRSGPTAVTVFELENGRGIQTLRGLSSQVEQIRLSPNGRFCAGLAHDWQVAIWELETGKLVRVLQPPAGFTADNAGFGFDKEGKRFAFSAGTQAKLWKVQTGEEINSWKIPPGLVDRLAFHPGGKLLLFRLDRDALQSIYRIRELAPNGKVRILSEDKGFSKGVLSTALAPDGSIVVVEAIDREDKQRHLVKGIDGLTGKEFWRLSLKKTRKFGTLHLDPVGKMLSLHPKDELSGMFIHMPSGKLAGMLNAPPAALGPLATYWVTFDADKLRQFTLFHRSDLAPIMNLSSGGPATDSAQFDVSGRYLAWGNADGTVNVCDLQEVQKRLANVGLGW